MTSEPFPLLEKQDRAGICSIEVHFPETYVSQARLELYDKGKPGKYTLGLGQSKMAFTTECEDICSLALTVVSKLIERDGIDYSQVGRLTVVTESQDYHAKSIKTVLMQLFEENGSSDVEVADYVNVCYSCSAAIFDAISWCERKDWDKRYALVVGVDIAVYEKGNGLPTGGAGAFCALIGREPAFYVEPVRASYMGRQYDFQKPNLSSPLPMVDGKHSNLFIAKAFDKCYKLLNWKFSSTRGVSPDDFSYFICQSPYHKLVQKTFSQVYWNDFKLNGAKRYPELQQFENSVGPNYDGALDNVLTKSTQKEFNEKGSAGCSLSKEVGNVLCASLWFSLASLSGLGDQLAGKRILSFSYGSGLCSTLFILRGGSTPSSIAKLQQLGRKCDFSCRLARRIEVAPEIFYAVHQKNETAFKLAIPRRTTTENQDTFYLVRKDDEGSRTYERGSPISEHDEESNIQRLREAKYTSALAGLPLNSALYFHLV